MVVMNLEPPLYRTRAGCQLTETRVMEFAVAALSARRPAVRDRRYND